MVQAQLYGNGGVLDYSVVKVYKDPDKLIHADMTRDAVVIELTHGDSILYLKIGPSVITEIARLKNKD